MRQINQKKYTPVEISLVNKLAEKDPVELVSLSEQYYNKQVEAAATLIQSRPQCKFILLCGPSASGKTTTAHKLKERLIKQGTGARVLSMDNFFIGVESYPLLEDGSPNMESIEAIDMDLLNKRFSELMANGEARFPIFDFATQQRHLRGHHVKLEQNDVLIMEGIHALNPSVLADIKEQNIFRIYVSVRTKFICGDETVLVPKDIRLIRRMVRDYKFRNHPPLETLSYWKHVVAAERINIDLYRDDVDLKMDNTIDYEVCVWHSMLHDLLKSINVEDFSSYPELTKIFTGLQSFPEINSKLIPTQSLLREFIGKNTSF